MSDKVLLSLQIDPETRRRLRILAAQTGVPIRKIVAQQIENLLAAVADQTLPTQTDNIPNGPHRLR